MLRSSLCSFSFFPFPEVQKRFQTHLFSSLFFSWHFFWTFLDFNGFLPRFLPCVPNRNDSKSRNPINLEIEGEGNKRKKRKTERTKEKMEEKLEEKFLGDRQWTAEGGLKILGLDSCPKKKKWCQCSYLCLARKKWQCVHSRAMCLCSWQFVTSQG